MRADAFLLIGEAFAHFLILFTQPTTSVVEGIGGRLFYNRNGARFSLGVAPRELRLSGRGTVVVLPGVPGSTDVRRGVCMPEGVDAPLVFLLFGSPISVGMLDDRLMPPFLVGAGDAAPEAVLDETPFVVVVVVVFPVRPETDPTDSRDGRGVDVCVRRRVGMRDGVASSVLSSDSVDPWRDGGFEPARLAGRELGREFALEPPGVI